MTPAEADREANAALQRDGYLVVASWEEESMGRVITDGFGPFMHPVVVIGHATKEDFERQHGPVEDNPYGGPRYFFKVTAE